MLVKLLPERSEDFYGSGGLTQLLHKAYPWLDVLVLY